MPYSMNVFDHIVMEILKLLKPKVFLDLGAGTGKWGVAIEKYDDSIERIAVEIEKGYIELFELAKKYNQVWNMSIVDLIQPKYYSSTFDVVMIGDVIEHLKKSDGNDLLNFLMYRSKWIVLIFPFQYLQNAVDGHESEAHLSVWGASDFQLFNSSILLSRQDKGLVILKGFLESEVRFADIQIIIGHEK